MSEGYLDERLIGQQFTITLADLLDGVSFYGIYYNLRATTSLHVGDLVEVVATTPHGLTVRVVVPHQQGD